MSGSIRFIWRARPPGIRDGACRWNWPIHLVNHAHDHNWLYKRDFGWRVIMLALAASQHKHYQD
jgi:hypothetical protein